jgi:spore maturation protein CgeB
VGREIETWDSPSALVEKVRTYKAHPEEAHLIAARGLDAVRSRHSIPRRVFEMLSDLPRKSVVAAVG